MVRLALKKEEQASGSSTTAQSPSSEWASVRRDTLGCVPSSLGSAWYQVGSSGLFCSLLDSWRGQEGAWRKHLLSSVWHRGQADLKVAIYFNLCHTQHPPSTHRTYLLLQNRSVVPTESPPPHLTSPLCPPFCRKDFTGLAAPAQDSPGHTYPADALPLHVVSKLLSQNPRASQNHHGHMSCFRPNPTKTDGVLGAQPRGEGHREELRDS